MSSSFVSGPFISGTINSSNPKNEVGKRVKELQKETIKNSQLLDLSNLAINPMHVNMYAVSKNNIMLDNVLANQEIIMKNQAQIMNKLGGSLDIQG